MQDQSPAGSAFTRGFMGCAGVGCAIFAALFLFGFLGGFIEAATH